MPVRIIFRGLMLFQLPDSGQNKGKLVACMINKPGDAKAREHAHDHQTQIQILTGAEQGTDLQAKVLNPEATLNITVPGTKGVDPRRSFREHIPDLARVIEKATIPTIPKAGRRDPDRTLIQNIVTVDGGIVRARNVTTWDEGGYPISGNRDEIGNRADLLAVLKFMGSSVEGHVATDVVVEIDGDSVELECEHDRRFHGGRKASDKPSDPNMPPGTVEISVSNYELPTEQAIPWGLDFQWLFEAAGYNAANLDSPEFKEWEEAGRAFNAKLFEEERAIFFPDGPTGRPFPYLRSGDDLTQLQPLTRPLNVYACKGALAPASPTI